MISNTTSSTTAKAECQARRIVESDLSDEFLKAVLEGDDNFEVSAADKAVSDRLDAEAGKVCQDTGLSAAQACAELLANGTLDELELHLNRYFDGGVIDEQRAETARRELVTLEVAPDESITAQIERLSLLFVYLLHGETNEPGFAPGTIEMRQIMDDMRYACPG